MPRKRPAAKTVPEIASVPSVPRRTPSEAVARPEQDRGQAPVVAYQSRIEVIEAWQYQGSVTGAPSYIDRNWIGYDTTPILRVPNPHHPDKDVICRIGDYVVRQSVTLAPGLAPEERLEVWPKADFERLFIPKRINGTDPALRPPGPKAPPPDIPTDMPDVDLEEMFSGQPYKPLANEAEDAGET